MKHLAVIGCGLRSDCYMCQLRDGLGKEWQLVALADPNPKAVEVYVRNFGNESIHIFSDGPELLEKMAGKLDAVIIASPNAKHLESVEPAMKIGLTILLEKPVATSVDDCKSMWHSYISADKPPLVVGFVLRYTNFYRKIKELIARGDCGQILSIEATEMMGAPLTTMFVRGWRRFEDMSGPLILEKCSHDLDLLNWFADSKASQVSSFGARTHFIKNPDAAMHCKDCSLKNSCRYAVHKIAPYLLDTSRKDELGELIPSDNDICVFNSDKDIWDHQVVNIKYENGILAGFTVCMDQPRTTRTIKINGTEAQIFGDIGKDHLEIRYHLKEGSEDEKIEQIPIEHDNSSHHGGDSVIANQLKAMLRGEQSPPLAGLREGIEACLLALAAERSAKENKIMNEQQIYQNLLE